jgi:hypothetical protein
MASAASIAVTAGADRKAVAGVPTIRVPDRGRSTSASLRLPQISSPDDFLQQQAVIYYKKGNAWIA